MIIKNLSRKAGTNGKGTSGQLVKYIFKYIFNEKKTKSNVLSSEQVQISVGERKQTRSNYRDYAQALKISGVRFTKHDINHLLVEEADRRLMSTLQNKITGTVIKLDEIEKNDFKEEKQPFIISHNIKSNSLNGIISEFEANEARRVHKRRDATHIHHTILSWSTKDREHITEAMLRDIAGKYIQLRGENNLYAGTLHNDRDHIHLHISMSGSQLNGMSSRISKTDFEAVKTNLQYYQRQKYPQLVNSLPEHGSKRKALEKGEVQKIKRTERAYVKNALLDHIGSISPKSRDDLLRSLSDRGFTAYYRNGELTGVRHETSNLLFRLSRIGVDLEAIKQFEKQKVKEEQLLAELQTIRKGERSRELEDRFGSIERESKDVEKDKDALKDIEDIRAGREVDDDSEREYETDDSNDDDTSDTDYSNDSEDDSDNEPEEVEEQELEDEEDDDDSEDIV